MKVAVIGIGQSMRGDDAAGLEAVRLWERRHTETSGRSDIQVQLLQQPGLDLLDSLQGADSAVIVDAVEPASRPGSVRLLDPEELDAALENGSSLHGWGIAEALALGYTMQSLPRELKLRCVGIEAEQFGVGAGLSKSVAEALPAACASIQELVELSLGA